jgi:hypothetical protein
VQFQWLQGESYPAFKFERTEHAPHYAFEELVWNRRPHRRRRHRRSTNRVGARAAGFRQNRVGTGGSFVPGFTLDGETFDGFTYYREIDGEEIALLPKLDKQMMFKGMLDTDMEKAAWSSATNAPATTETFGGVGKPVEATFQQLNVDVRSFFLSHRAGSTYVLAGVGFPWSR